MSEQPKHGDRKIVKQGENKYQVHIFDSAKGKFVDRGHADGEGIRNLVNDISSGKTDLAPKPIGTDKDGNPVYRLNKNT